MNQSAEMVKIAEKALEDKKAEDIRVIDIREISTIADFFVIANGTNANQLAAMRDAVDEELYKAGYTGPFMYEVKTSEYKEFKDLYNCYQNLYQNFIDSNK